MRLDLSDEETLALLNLLTETIEADRYPMSPRIQTFRGILEKFGPMAPAPPPPRPTAEERDPRRAPVTGGGARDEIQTGAADDARGVRCGWRPADRVVPRLPPPGRAGTLSFHKNSRRANCFYLDMSHLVLTLAVLRCEATG